MSDPQALVEEADQTIWQDGGYVLTTTELKVYGPSDEGPQDVYSLLNVRDVAVKRSRLRGATLLVWVTDAEGRLDTIKLKSLQNPSEARRKILEQARQRRMNSTEMKAVEPDRVTQSLASHQAQVLDEPERERVRAQRGSVIATAAATALASIGALGDLDERSLLVLGLGLAALVAWLLAAALFIGATVGFRRPEEGLSEAPMAFVALLDSATVEFAQVHRRTRAAFAVAIVAALLTLATIIVTAFDEPSGQSTKEKVDDAVEAVRIDEAAEAATTGDSTLVLTSSGTTMLRRECPDLGRPPRGRIDPDSLGGNFVEVTFGAGLCRDTTQTILIPASNLVGTRASSP